MTKVKFKAKAEDAAKAGEDLGDFVVPKPGFYHLRIAEANPGFSKGEDGEEDEEKPRIEIVYEVVGVGAEAAEPTENYGRIWDYITFGDGYAATRRTEFAEALNPGAKERIQNGEELTFDTDEMLERVVYARLKTEKDKRRSAEEGKTVNRARVASVFPLSEADSTGFAQAEFDSDAFGSTDNSDPFDSGNGDEEAAEEPAEEPAEEASDGDLLTEEELSEYDMKELGAVAQEFDLDPNDFIVRYQRGANKGKVKLEETKKAVIAAILEAQGGDEADGGDEDDSPF